MNRLLMLLVLAYATGCTSDACRAIVGRAPRTPTRADLHSMRLTSINWQDMPLYMAFDRLAHECGWTGLGANRTEIPWGFDPTLDMITNRVTVVAKRIRADAVLDEISRQVGATWHIEQDGLWSNIVLQDDHLGPK